MKMAIPRILIVTLTLILMSMMMMVREAHSMRFDIHSGETRCIAEDIKEKAVVVGHFIVVNPTVGSIPDARKISVRVASPNGLNHYQGDRVDSGHFAFTASESGDYSACFWASHQLKPEAVMTVELDWRTGISARDWPKVAKKGKIDVMKFELEKLSDTVTSIHDEMFFLREREEEMQQLNRATNLKMATFSFLSIVICLSVAGIQFWHLKAFFESKKLL